MQRCTEQWFSVQTMAFTVLTDSSLCTEQCSDVQNSSVVRRQLLSKYRSTAANVRNRAAMYGTVQKCIDNFRQSIDRQQLIYVVFERRRLLSRNMRIGNLPSQGSVDGYDMSNVVA